MYLAIHLLPGAVFAIVAGSGSHDDTSINQATDCAAYWIVLVGINSRRPQTHIDHKNVISSMISQYPIESAQCPGNRTRSYGVQHAQVNDVGVWRDADILRICNATITRGDRGDVRPMAEGIISAILASEVMAEIDAALTISTEKRSVPGIDTGINDRDADAGAVDRGCIRG